jgi:hypothetical protein
MSTIIQPLSLVFSPKFGAPHEDPDGEVRYYRDRYLRGRTLVFYPELRGAEPRTTFEVGRHSACWCRIGRNGVISPDGDEYGATDQMGYEYLSAFSRVHITFVWADAKAYPWLSESKWLVLLGGVFVGTDGRKESSLPRNGVYLEGRRLSDNDNPEPLFAPGDYMARISLGITGRILVFERALDEHSTGLPRSIWEGDGWPIPEPPPHPPTLQRLELEQQVASEKHATVTVAPTTWQGDLLALIERTPNTRLVLYALLAIASGSTLILLFKLTQ